MEPELDRFIEGTRPLVVAFCCNWCAYLGADLAGVSRIQYPPNIRIIRVMCSGRVDSAFVIKAFELGADGVLIAGCWPGDCHYLTGNLKAEERVKIIREILDVLGIEQERLRLEWVAASEGGRFAEVVRDFVSDLMNIGPSPLRR